MLRGMLGPALTPKNVNATNRMPLRSRCIKIGVRTDIRHLGRAAPSSRRWLCLAAVILLLALVTAAHAENMHRHYRAGGMAWDCRYIDAAGFEQQRADLEELREKCYACEEKGQEFFRTSPSDGYCVAALSEVPEAPPAQAPPKPRVEPPPPVPDVRPGPTPLATPLPTPSPPSMPPPPAAVPSPPPTSSAPAGPPPAAPAATPVENPSTSRRLRLESRSPKSRTGGSGVAARALSRPPSRIGARRPSRPG